MIQIINTGVANIRSLQAAFDRLGHAWNLTENASEIKNASHVVLPGVGAFAAAAESLDRLKIRESIKARLEDPAQSTLCICLGMQLLCDASEESESAIGLRVIPATIKRFGTDVPVPQLGWNAVTPKEQSTAPYGPGEAYFANSFRLLAIPPDDWGYAETVYGGAFVSSVWRGKMLACQYHPELSGTWGQTVLANWIAGNVVQERQDA